jgi:hypothetical protein
MDINYIFWVLLPIIGYFGYRHNVKTAYKALVLDGDFVIISANSIARDTRFFKQKIKVSAIVKVQISDCCVSLFNSSNHAIDIWLPSKKAINVVADRAVNIFKNAVVVNVTANKPFK